MRNKRHVDELEFLSRLYQLDVHRRYARLCRMLSSDPSKLTVERLEVKEIVQQYFPGAKSHSRDLIWTYRRFIDRHQLVIVLWVPQRVLEQGATSTFMLILRWENEQICSVAMRNILIQLYPEHQHYPLYVHLYNQEDLTELVLFSRVLYDDVYASLVRVAG